jgi:hypothetical protein
VGCLYEPSQSDGSKRQEGAGNIQLLQMAKRVFFSSPAHTAERFVRATETASGAHGTANAVSVSQKIQYH